jgi:hypothetical protein
LQPEKPVRHGFPWHFFLTTKHLGRRCHENFILSRIWRALLPRCCFTGEGALVAITTIGNIPILFAVGLSAERLAGVAADGPDEDLRVIYLSPEQEHAVLRMAARPSLPQTVGP